MAKKSILYIVTQSEWGGAQRYIFDLAMSLRGRRPKQSRGNNTGLPRSPDGSLAMTEVIVAAGQNPDGLLFKKLQAQGIQTHYLKYLKRAICPYTDCRAFFELRNLIGQLKPDIIHLNSSKAGVLGALAAKKIKTIYTVHGWVFNEPLPWWLKKIYFWVEKISAQWKDKIICVSEFDRQVALKTGLCPSEKLITIHNGIDLAKMEFLSKEEARQGLPLRIRPGQARTYPKGRPLASQRIIGTIAHFYPTKGLKYLIGAAPILLEQLQLPLLFIIIGDGPERPKLEKLIKKYHLENHCFLLGQIPQAAKYLKAFDIFVLSSVKEGLPYTVLEAMAAQVPVVATKVGGVPEMLSSCHSERSEESRRISMGSGVYPERSKEPAQDDNLNLVPSKNSQALAAKIIYLLKHPEMAQQTAQQAREKVAKEFSLEKMIKETTKVLEQLQ